MQIVSNRETLHEMSTLFLCVCVEGGGGGMEGWIFDPLTFTTLWANSADENLLVFLNYHSLNILLFLNLTMFCFLRLNH